MLLYFLLAENSLKIIPITISTMNHRSVSGIGCLKAVTHKLHGSLSDVTHCNQLIGELKANKPRVPIQAVRINSELVRTPDLLSHPLQAQVETTPSNIIRQAQYHISDPWIHDPSHLREMVFTENCAKSYTSLLQSLLELSVIFLVQPWITLTTCWRCLMDAENRIWWTLLQTYLLFSI